MIVVGQGPLLRQSFLIAFANTSEKLLGPLQQLRVVASKINPALAITEFIL